MALKDDFKSFCDEISLSNRDDMETSAGEIAKKLNNYYYDLSGDDKSHMYIVGSVGRYTAVDSCSDLDLLFDLPHDVYVKYNGYESNGQSVLLQDVKNVLRERYPKTEISGDGQVVVIDFNQYTVELVPGFKQDDDSFKYPDTHDGGSWKKTDPLKEQEECNIAREASYGTFYDFCHMLREWKNNIGFSFKGLLIDTLVHDHFEDNDWYADKGYEDYLEILANLYEYLKEQDKDQSFWYALGSNQKIYNDDNGKFISKAKAAFNKLNGTTNSTEGINDTLRELLGSDFPEAGEARNKTASFSRSVQKTRDPFARGDNTEEFIWERFSVDIRYNVMIDCKVSQDGFRPFLLRGFLAKPFAHLKHNRRLDFYVEATNCPKPYKVYWKVRNVGDEAERLHQIRGEISIGASNEHWQEHTSFYGPHYVECYLIKNGVCVAKDRIDVPIE